MVNVKQAGAKRLKMSERAQQQQELHFPHRDPLWLWQRKVNDGYTTVPRTLPLVMQAVDDQSKGQPAGHTLFCLWARCPDHAFIVIENPVTFAAEAGFSGERAVDTWRRRMKRLADLHFIEAKKGPAGDFSYVLLKNPNVAMEWMRQSGLVQDDLYGRFLSRAADIGAFSEIEAVRTSWEAFRAAQAAQAAQAAPAPPAAPGMMQPAGTGLEAGAVPRVAPPPPVIRALSGAAS